MPKKQKRNQNRGSSPAYRRKREDIIKTPTYQVDRLFFMDEELDGIEKVEYWNSQPAIELKVYDYPTSYRKPLNFDTVSICIGLSGVFWLSPDEDYARGAGEVKIDSLQMVIIPQDSLFYISCLYPAKFLLIKVMSFDRSLSLFAGNWYAEQVVNMDLSKKIDLKRGVKDVYNSPLAKLFPVRTIWRHLNRSRLYLLVGPKRITPGLDYALRGPDRIIINLCRTRLGQGPIRHFHRKSWEHFLVIKGTYAVKVDGVEIIVKAGQIIQIAPGRLREFKQIECDNDLLIDDDLGSDGLILPIVVGVDTEAGDITFPADVEDEIKKSVGWWGRLLLCYAKFRGLTFEKEPR
jgi:hypothetical protein